jgi:hypothetical protein
VVAAAESAYDEAVAPAMSARDAEIVAAWAAYNAAIAPAIEDAEEIR